MKTKIALERKLIGKFFKIKSRTVLCKKIYDFNSINDFKMNGIAFHPVTGIIDSNYYATCNWMKCNTIHFVKLQKKNAHLVTVMKTDV